MAKAMDSADKARAMEATVDVMAKPLEMETARAMDVLTVIAKPTEMDTARAMEATVDVMAKPLEMETARAMDVLTVMAKPTEMDTARAMEAEVGLWRLWQNLRRWIQPGLGGYGVGYGSYDITNIDGYGQG